MLVKKSRWVDLGKYGWEVGDIISFKMTDGELIQAMAVKQKNDGMLFCQVDCLRTKYAMYKEVPMDGSGESYRDSDLRYWLNSKIIARVPADITDKMVPFEHGDYLRLPTEKEIFGENYYGGLEACTVQQWAPMKQRRNRVVLQVYPHVDLEEYWLMTKCRGNNHDFLCARPIDPSRADSSYAIFAKGVRLVFKLRLPDPAAE